MDTQACVYNISWDVLRAAKNLYNATHFLGGTAVTAPAADRKKLATEWKSNPAVAGAQPWKIRRPVPDAAVAGTPGR